MQFRILTKNLLVEIAGFKGRFKNYWLNAEAAPVLVRDIEKVSTKWRFATPLFGVWREVYSDEEPQTEEA